MKQLFCTMMLLATLSSVSDTFDSFLSPNQTPDVFPVLPEVEILPPIEPGEVWPDELLGNHDNEPEQDQWPEVEEWPEEEWPEEEPYLPEEGEIISKEIPIFMYHHLSETTSDGATILVDTFRSHIQALSEAGVQAVSFDQLIDFVHYGGDLPENPVVITFDDGYRSNYEYAFPILKEYNMPATIFVIGITVGKDTYRDTGVSILPHFSYREAQEMLNSDLVSIQSHSYDLHQWAPLEIGVARSSVLQLESESDQEYIQVITADYLRSKSEIENNTSETVNVFSYPGGAYSDFSEQILSSLGVMVTVSVNPATNTIVRGQPESLFALNRYSMDSVTDINLVLQRAGVA